MIDVISKHRETEFVIDYQEDVETILIYFEGQKNKTPVSPAQLRDLGELLISIAEKAEGRAVLKID